MDHLIIGAGPAGVIAAETIARNEPGASVTVIGAEAETPYSRMAIPYLLAQDIDEPGTHLRHGAGHYASLGIELVNDTVTSLDPSASRVALAGGGDRAFDRLLIATGSHTTRPPIEGMDLDGIENCWTLEDARRIIAAAGPGSRVVLMGAGFIGCIVLEALAARNVELTVVEMEPRMLARMMDETGGEMLKDWCESKGVRVLTGVKVQAIEKSGDALSLRLSEGDDLAADLVVCATGVRPNVDFLDGSGIAVGEGIEVDHHLKTSVDHVYAAGDVAAGFDFSSGSRDVHAIQPTASEHGRIAALNMIGRPTRYQGSLSMNVLNTLGLISSSFGLWQGVEQGERTVALNRAGHRYLRLEFEDDRLIGALSLGLTQHVGVIRGLIQTRVRLGEWKQRLIDDPNLVMHAYLACTQGKAA